MWLRLKNAGVVILSHHFFSCNIYYTHISCPVSIKTFELIKLGQLLDFFLPLSCRSCCIHALNSKELTWYLEDDFRQLGIRHRSSAVCSGLCIKKTKAWTSEPWVWLLDCALEKQMFPPQNLWKHPHCTCVNNARGNEKKNRFPNQVPDSMLWTAWNWF